MKDFLDSSEWRFGLEPLEKRLNVRSELRRLREDPLAPLIASLEPHLQRKPFLLDEIDAYQQAYQFYYLSLARFLPISSLFVRCSWRKYWDRKRGGSYVSAHHRKLAQQQDRARPYMLYDFWSCLLHSRILMDRTIHLARSFLTQEPRPSFTSFNDHKKFFARRADEFPRHGAYARHIRDNTNWFDAVKFVRDKFLVHAGPKHMWHMAYPGGREHELMMVILVPTKPNEEKYLREMKYIGISVPRLMTETDAFLRWFSAYGTAALSA